jgi:putative membrane protein
VEVQVEISLGQLAAQRASNKEVREFGQQMVEDHKKVGQQVELLALKHGITLSPGEDHEHHKKLEELSRLSGHAFDREYMDYSIRDHESTLEAFQRRAQIVQDQDIKQWISLLLPILEGHREKAHRVKYSLQTNP